MLGNPTSPSSTDPSASASARCNPLGQHCCKAHKALNCHCTLNYLGLLNAPGGGFGGSTPGQGKPAIIPDVRYAARAPGDL